MPVWSGSISHILAGTESCLPIAKQQRMAIEGLLNDGTSSFVQAFDLPSSELRSPRPQSPSRCADSTVNEHVSDGLLDGVAQSNDPFAVPWIDPYTETAVFGFPYDYIDFEAGLESDRDAGFHYETLGDLEDEAGQRIRSTIEDKIREVGLDEHLDLFRCSQLLFSGNNVAVHISQFFGSWHHACPIIHEPSFDRHSVPLKLLIIMCLLGAMYSKERAKKLAARQLLDVAELVIFDAGASLFVADIKQHIRADREYATVSERDHPWDEFQELQATFLMVEAQYWAGSRPSRRRAIESRFGDVIRVC